MHFAILFFIELFVLFLLSKSLTNHLSAFFYRVTGSKKLTIYLLAILFFPGTVVHELAHYIMARLLFVPVHHIEFFPKMERHNVKLGSVTMDKKDFLRRLLIGMAPFFVGTVLLLGTLSYAVRNNLLNNYAVILLIGYLVFEIGNTMFSSKRDLEGASRLLLILVPVITLFLYFNPQIPFLNPDLLFSNQQLIQIFEKGALYLLAPLGIDIVVILLLKLLK